MFWALLFPVILAAPRTLPLVDPGLFVISGVKTCGEGSGFCMLGSDCTLDEDFKPNNEAGQHCEGLKSAFSPSAHFICCQASNKTSYKPPIIFPSVTDSQTDRTNINDQLLEKTGHVLLQITKSVKIHHF